MSTYNRFIGNQRHFSKDKLDVKILTRAMRRLSKLESIEVDWNNPFIGSNEIIRSFGMFRGDTLISFDGVHFMPVLFQALAASDRKLRRLHLGYSDLLDHQRNTRTLRDIGNPLLPKKLSGSYASDTSVIKTLGPEALTLLVKNTNIGPVSKAMKRVREFSFSPNQGLGSTADDMMDMMPPLSRLIALSESLRTVLVSMVRDDGMHGIRLPMKSLVPLSIAPRLERLELVDVEASSAELIQMLNRHAQTLVHVEIIYSNVTDADWEGVITQLRAIEFKKLKYFIVPEPNCGDPTEVHNYILRKTERNPFEIIRRSIEKEEESSEG